MHLGVQEKKIKYQQKAMSWQFGIFGFLDCLAFGISMDLAFGIWHLAFGV